VWGSETRYAVGEFGSQSADGQFGETVRPRTPSRNPDHLDAHIGQDSIKRRGELAGGVCPRKMQGATIRHGTYYRCTARTLAPGAAALMII
jgi:hypothetical protein